MSVFFIHRTNINILKYIGCFVSLSSLTAAAAETFVNTPQNIQLWVEDNSFSCSLFQYLRDIKNQISVYGAQWDSVKRYTNTYEFIHTCIPNRRFAVCQYYPLSRSFFKMIEIVHCFCGEMQNILKKTAVSSFHLAEGPGGFIEATMHLRQKGKSGANTNTDKHIGMTLIDDQNEGIPGWRKSREFMRRNSGNVHLEFGRDGTGNILSVENMLHCYEQYSHSMDFITADGGFDFSVDFDRQEANMLPLLFAEICFALLMQKHNGTFVLKVFDCFLAPTQDIVYILSAMYEKVSFFKPQTSRAANSEKYLVCTGFIPESNAEFAPKLIHAFAKMVNGEGDCMNDPAQMRFLSCQLPYFFLKRMEDCNAFYGQQQLENILQTINLIENKCKNDQIDILCRQNIKRCISWCHQHDMPVRSNISF